MDSILTYPVIPLDIYKRYRRNKNNPVHNSASMMRLLDNLIRDAEKNDKSTVSNLAKLILFDFKNYLNHPVISKEKYTANALENRLALLGNGRTSDNLSKSNPNINVLLEKSDLELIPEDVHHKICSNYREKGDLLFYEPLSTSTYKVSIKSLISTNKEINFGAFDFTSLILDILEDDFLSLGERRSTKKINVKNKTYNIGRGSKNQLLGLFSYLNEINKLDEFIKRWEIVFKGVFKEDVLIYIKNYDRLQFFLLSNDNFIKCISDSLNKHWNNKKESVINRWEGNSIRMDKDIIIKYCSYKVDRDFKDFFNEGQIISSLKETQINKTEKLLNINFS